MLLLVFLSASVSREAIPPAPLPALARLDAIRLGIILLTYCYY